MKSTAPIRYWLPPHVLATARPEGTVLLDTRKNRYYAVSKDDSDRLSHLILNWPTRNPSAPITQYLSVDTPACLNSLRGAHLLIQSEVAPTARSVNSLSRATTSVGEELHLSDAPSATVVVNATAAYLWAAISIRAFSFETLSAKVMQTRGNMEISSNPVPDAKIVKLVSLFRSARPYVFVAKEKCLVHSLALFRFLAHYGVTARWVVGIKLYPWGAHSWMQQGAFVLDSTPEKVNDFSPILVV